MRRPAGTALAPVIGGESEAARASLTYLPFFFFMGSLWHLLAGQGFPTKRELIVFLLDPQHKGKSQKSWRIIIF